MNRNRLTFLRPLSWGVCILGAVALIGSLRWLGLAVVLLGIAVLAASVYEGRKHR